MILTILPQSWPVWLPGLQVSTCPLCQVVNKYHHCHHHSRPCHRHHFHHHHHQGKCGGGERFPKRTANPDPGCEREDEHYRCGQKMRRLIINNQYSIIFSYWFLLIEREDEHYWCGQKMKRLITNNQFSIIFSYWLLLIEREDENYQCGQRWWWEKCLYQLSKKKRALWMPSEPMRMLMPTRTIIAIIQIYCRRPEFLFF